MTPFEPPNPDLRPHRRPDQPYTIDVKTPNVARMYDYYLGGKDNTLADRECAEEVIRRVPQTRDIAWANRRFLGRAVRHAATELGIAQFIDIGAGLPTRENVHQVAQRANPESRVVYVDNDPVVLVHARALLARDPQTKAIAGDVRDPLAVLDDQELRTHLDLTRPVAVLLVAVLHFVTDEEEPYEAVRKLMDSLVPGSCLVLSHVEAVAQLDAAVKAYERASSPAVLRSEEEVTAFFDGLRLVPPGVVRLKEWRPDNNVFRFDPDVPIFGGVGVKEHESLGLCTG
ncbi:SAM-dependent methyltransferase [Acrocarpospora catenulata]|uniref:SAM-dependent methyltransferase n=1 Tax=Acrocarpospora catenulata TaxID=2836182 RepID=UPI001BDA7216|nr:SAM-dependent methyltransferase [Acrocarpospora catenulata]